MTKPEHVYDRHARLAKDKAAALRKAADELEAQIAHADISGDEVEELNKRVAELKLEATQLDHEAGE